MKRTILKRREFLGATALTLGCGSLVRASTAPEAFEFAFLTDFHIQPELGASEGVRKCLAKFNSLERRPEMVITGGDLIMDALDVDQDRLALQWKLFDEAMKAIETPVHHTIGNHDVTGWTSKGKIGREAENYGKRIFEDRYGQGRTYRGFDHKGWHFVLLDSIAQDPKTGDYLGLIDEKQADWLRNDLSALPRETPVVLVTHIPFYSIMHQYTNGPARLPDAKALVGNVKELRKILDPARVKLVLSGHGHVLERIEFAGTVYLQGGAVSGLWWKGPVHGNPEGFVVVKCFPDGRFETRYESYGWVAKTS